MNQPAPDSSHPDTNGPLLHALLMVVLLALTKIAGFITFDALAGPTEEDVFAGGATSFVAMGLIFVLWITLIMVGIVRWRRTSLAALGWSGWSTLRDLGLGALGAATCIGILLVAYRSVVGEVDSLLENVSGFSLQQRLLFMLIGTMAAFGEETVFRGYLQPALIRRMGKWPGILVGAALFSLYHLQFRPLSLITKFLYGIVFAVLRERTQSLWTPAVAHFLFWAVLGAA